MRKNTRKWM